jgi:catechol 2,3-dioxygenase-like lactoylglutathione lyase family enzyme
MIFNSSFHHVAIRTTEWDKAIKFYKALGFAMFVEWKEEMGRCCFMRTNGSFFMEIKEFTKQIQEPCRLQHICFHTDDVDAFYKVALENGATIQYEPKNIFLNSTPMPLKDFRWCHVIGPSGEEIELLDWKKFNLND